MKKVLAFDIDQTLNIAKTPIPDEIAELLTKCLDHYEICPISGQKFDQFLIQIVDRLKDATPEQLSHLHLFVAQGTQYYRYNIEKKDWEQIYNYPLTDEQVKKISEAIETAAKENGFWEIDKVAEGDEIIENRLSTRETPSSDEQRDTSRPTSTALCMNEYESISVMVSALLQISLSHLAFKVFVTQPEEEASSEVEYFSRAVQCGVNIMGDHDDGHSVPVEIINETVKLR